MVSPKKRDEDQRLHVETDLARMEERLDQIYDAVGNLVELLSVRETTAAEQPKRKAKVPSQAQWRAAAFRARQGRAAKRMGISLEKFLETYGDTDKLPDEE